MPDTSSLLERMDAEFAAVEARVKQYQDVQIHEYEAKKLRLERLEHVFADLRGIWNPRLELLAKKFGDRVEVKPHLTPSAKEATFAFKSKLAHIELRLAARTDADIRKIILTYDLDILPILMRFESHAEIEFPLDEVDQAAVGQWIDDRIVSFVKTNLSLHENEQYLKDAMVEDPIAGVRFPKYAAAIKLEHDGQTHYFLGEETKREFEKLNGLAPS